jgi:hypothetical protein
LLRLHDPRQDQLRERLVVDGVEPELVVAGP